MSWLPDKDPVLGDPKSCDALELVVVPRVRDLGDGFSVRRALPHGKRQMVGPFIFFDQMGPVQKFAPLDTRLREPSVLARSAAPLIPPEILIVTMYAAGVRA